MTKRRTGRILLAGLAAAGAATGAGLLHNRRPDRREHLHVTLFSEPGYLGRNRTLTWKGGKHLVVPLGRTGLPRIGSIRLERLVYRIRPEVRPPDGHILRRALIERLDPDDSGDGVYGFVAVNQIAGMFSMGRWETVPESEARSGVRLRTESPGTPPSASGKAIVGDAASDAASAPDIRPWHDVLTNTPDLGPWNTRTRYLELGYHGGRVPRGGHVPRD
ncbi:hypothetical protein ACFYXP_08780 [Streptomyces sp. NPDC002466]|uniref:hypothetical protein n=1 Tax=unclassified Streptomyces TaxID=2593676 RepID=UPI0011E75844|nr:hypothetical protein [Streptomyces sp. sk2.1]TXS74944.1 hypothetical protein EAO76_14695 [Streptomyces sp. sk2.1]